MKRVLLISLVLLSTIGCIKSYKAPIIVEGCGNTVNVYYQINPIIEKQFDINAETDVGGL